MDAISCRFALPAFAPAQDSQVLVLLRCRVASAKISLRARKPGFRRILQQRGPDVTGAGPGVVPVSSRAVQKVVLSAVIWSIMPVGARRLKSARNRRFD
jgi:hypothetical protein